MPEEISTIVMEILGRRKKIDPSAISAETTLASLGIDSLEGLEVIFALEDRFGISIPDDEANDMKTVGAVIAGVQRLLDKPPAGSL